MIEVQSHSTAGESRENRGFPCGTLPTLARMNGRRPQWSVSVNAWPLHGNTQVRSYSEMHSPCSLLRPLVATSGACTN